MMLKRWLIPLLVIGLMAAIADPASAQRRGRRGREKEKLETLPALTFAKLYNNEHNLSLTDLQGYVVIVEFWATWCPPCRTTIPHLNEMHARLKDKGVIFIGVTTEDPKVVEKFMKTTKMDYLVLVTQDRSKTFDLFKMNGIPHAFLFDPTGKIRWNGHPMADMEQQIEHVIRTTPPTRRIGAGPEFNASMLDEAEAAMLKNNHSAALNAIGSIDEFALMKEEEHMERYVALVSKLTPMGEADYASAKKDIRDGNLKEAMNTLERLSQDYRKMPLGAKASAELLKIKQKPEFRAIQRIESMEKSAQSALKRAMKAKSDGNDIAAYRRFLSIARRYEGTKSAEKAAGFVTEYENDEAFMTKLNDDDSGG